MFKKILNLISKNIFLFLGTLVLVLISINLKSKPIVLFASLLGFWANFLSARGKIVSQLISVAAVILLLIISIPQRYYGEIIIIIFITLPLKIGSAFSWMKNKDKNREIVKGDKLEKNEWKLIMILSICLSIGMYFLLKLLGTNNLLVSTFSAITNIVAAYLLLRRNKNSFLLALTNDFFRLLLWILPTIQGDWSLLTLVITRIIYLVTDFYGYLNWTKIEKENIQN